MNEKYEKVWHRCTFFGFRTKSVKGKIFQRKEGEISLHLFVESRILKKGESR